jgi:hypothetical protein
MLVTTKRREPATDVAIPRPVHKVRYAAMQAGHLGSKTSIRPDPTHAPTPRNERIGGP